VNLWRKHSSFLNKGKEPTSFNKYAFVNKDSIKRWNSKSKNFDPSYPPTAVNVCWDFRSFEEKKEFKSEIATEQVHMEGFVKEGEVGGRE